MPDWFKPNIGMKGRVLRGILGLVLIVAGVWLWESLWWAGMLCLACAALALFEGLRGWCAARACGIRTRF